MKGGVCRPSAARSDGANLGPHGHALEDACNDRTAKSATCEQAYDSARASIPRSTAEGDAEKARIEPDGTR
jgi:hypothetical protein